MIQHKTAKKKRNCIGPLIVAQEWVMKMDNSLSAVPNIIYIKFPLVPIGVLAPGSAHARPYARPPIDTSGNFPAHVSAE